MKFSFIVPVYNVEQYLEECVVSLENQSFDSFEIILVDDGSTDSSGLLCDSLAGKDERISVIHKKNGGLSDARNVGVEHAAGDYLCFIDSDDFLNDADTLQKFFQIINETNADVVQYGHRKYYNAEKRYEVLAKRDFSKYNGEKLETVIDKLISEEALAISACATVISKKFLTENLLFFKKGIKTEDLEWSIRLWLCKPRIAFCDDSMYVYRMQREGSISATVDYNHLLDYCWILESSVELIEQGDPCLQKPLMSYLMYHALILSALVYRSDLTVKQRNTVLNRVKKVCKRRLIHNNLCKKVRAVIPIYMIFGYRPMTMFLGFYLKHRGR